MQLFYARSLGLFAVLKAVSIVLHYTGPSPFGGPLVLHPSRYLPEALLVECSLLALLSLFAAVLESVGLRFSSRAADALKPNRWIRGFRGLYLGFCGAWLIFGQFDYEVVRWLGQHMTLSFLRNYAGADDANLMGRILSGDAFYSGLAALQCLTVLAVVARAMRSIPLSKNLPRRWVGYLLFVSVLGVTTPAWLRPSEKRWRRVQPAQLGILTETWERLFSGSDVRNPEQARTDLIKIVHGGKSAQLPKWPAYSDENVGALWPDEFRKLPRASQPDVFLIVFETMRGWNTGFVGGLEEEAAMPKLRQRLQRDAIVFPRVHSAGYPSVEGAMGIHLGMWPHHSKIVLSDYLHIQTMAFPEMLRAAGYRSHAILGADPAFSNFTPWFRRWYDSYEFNPEAATDRQLVSRAIELHQTADNTQPRFWMLWTATTHPPYDVPEHSGVKPADTSEARYLQAMTYADAELDRLLEHLQQSNRWNNTVVFLLGDHSQPTPYQWRNTDSVGELSAGHTWTSLAILGGWPGLAAPHRDERAISHLDVAPTLLSLLNLRHGNAFFGRNVLADDQTAPVYSFRYGAVMREQDGHRQVFRMSGDEHLSLQVNVNDARSYGTLEGGVWQDAPQELDVARLRDAIFDWAGLLDSNRVVPPLQDGRPWLPEQ